MSDVKWSVGLLHHWSVVWQDGRCSVGLLQHWSVVWQDVRWSVGLLLHWYVVWQDGRWSVGQLQHWSVVWQEDHVGQACCGAGVDAWRSLGLLPVPTGMGRPGSEQQVSSLLHRTAGE